MAQYIKDNGEWIKIGGVEKYPADFGTRAEFEAKKDDLPVGTVFTTTDEFEEGEKEFFSTDEVKTNKVWIDGKPIYRRVIKIDSTFTITSDNWTNVTNMLGTEETLVDCSDVVRKDCHSFNICCYFEKTSKKIQLFAYRNLTIENGGHFIIQYTKTTD